MDIKAINANFEKKLANHIQKIRNSHPYMRKVVFDELFLDIYAVKYQIKRDEPCIMSSNKDLPRLIAKANKFISQLEK